MGEAEVHPAEEYTEMINPFALALNVPYCPLLPAVHTPMADKLKLTTATQPTLQRDDGQKKNGTVARNSMHTR
jgi:hypothetical protein